MLKRIVYGSQGSYDGLTIILNTNLHSMSDILTYFHKNASFRLHMLACGYNIHF